MSQIQRLPFNPALAGGESPRRLLLVYANELKALPSLGSSIERNSAIEACRKRAIKERQKCHRLGRQGFVAAVHVLTDLIKQGWQIKVARRQISLLRQEASPDTPLRDRIRNQLHAERDEQLRQPATASFIRSMEARKLHKGQLVSVFSLMRDGRELADALASLTGSKVCPPSKCVSPYLQFIRTDTDACEFTGFRLTDVWRYFRHTWSSPYKSIPGRSMMILVRDAAVEFHPVVGIAAVSSAAVAVTARDERIGWNGVTVLKEITDRPSSKLAKWIVETVDRAVDEIYKIDLFESDHLSTATLKRPNDEVIEGLEKEGRQQRKEHHRFMDSGAYKGFASANEVSDGHWERQARSSLFRSKRCLELANLLSIRKVLVQFFGKTPDRKALMEFAASREGKEAISKIVRKAKSDRVGTAIADLTVCGAVPPYNELLAGKLIAMLLVSPPVAKEYHDRYSRTPSVIASSMAGRPLCRPADLVFIGTTSLYGQRPSQYDRIAIPPIDDDSAEVRYEYLGKTLGFGTFQFNEQTVAELARLLAQSKSGQQVNSVFGEGVNPRLRKIRDGLDLLGLPTNELLNHGAPRLVYGVDLTTNTGAYLLGLDKKPKFRMSSKTDAVNAINYWWFTRWVLPRIAREDAIDRIRGHNLIHPIRHGARVTVLKDDGWCE